MTNEQLFVNLQQHLDRRLDSIESRMATKDDLAGLRHELKADVAELKHEVKTG
ncbi:hypothetical protein ACFPM7_28175 [Actinokineospora guangxiensis]|uniref:Uncharacterized protein n=1 Tax=Actinokineospora guangxiensis TaxID=1490288 RepID=A0ABW0EZE2_9PSEU